MPLLDLLTIAGAALASDPSLEYRRACAARMDARPVVTDVSVERRVGVGGDLPYLHIVDRRSGGSMNAYYDPRSERAAEARAACLGAQLRLLASETGDDRRGVSWNDVAFTSDRAYVPPRGEGRARWTIPVREDGTLDAAGQRMVVLTMPHEQVHAFQGRAGTRTPRWFHEGHAEWVGRKISTRIAPDERPASKLEAAKTATGSPSPALGSWGGVTPKREAILRQVSEEDRRRMAAEPTYMPPGPFRFDAGDLVGDDGRAAERYEAAWAVFRDLELRHGDVAVNAWVAGLTARKGVVAGDEVLTSARSSLNEDLAGRLK